MTRRNSFERDFDRVFKYAFVGIFVYWLLIVTAIALGIVWLFHHV